jgi:hypothetical protein
MELLITGNKSQAYDITLLLVCRLFQLLNELNRFSKIPYEHYSAEGRNQPTYFNFLNSVIVKQTEEL